MRHSVAWLFVPGTRADRFAKARNSGADEIILDLEDAVAPDEKVAARFAVAEWLDDGGAGWVRINANGSPWHEGDIAALMGLTGLRGIVLPKADGLACQQLARGPARAVPVLALLETARGVSEARTVATSPGVERLAFGSIDYALDIDAVECDETLLTARSALVLESRLAGLPAPVDAVTPVVDDELKVSEDATRAKRLGFGGKFCIHPRQVAVVTEAFAPSVDEISWASAVLSSLQSVPCSGVATMGGHMIDRPVVERAHRILGRVRRDDSPHTTPGLPQGEAR